MKLALFADIHSNLEALTACLAHAQALGAERYAFLGDLVGYGADPVAVLELIEQHAADGAVVVLGNHDAAAIGRSTNGMNSNARAAIIWTQTQLGERQRAFLGGLPLTVRDDNILFVHASAAAPEQWIYVTGPSEAEESITAGKTNYIFCGHVHEQKLYYMGAGGRPCLSGRSPGLPSLRVSTANGWPSSAPPASRATATTRPATRFSTWSGNGSPSFASPTIMIPPRKRSALPDFPNGSRCAWNAVRE